MLSETMAQQLEDERLRRRFSGTHVFIPLYRENSGYAIRREPVEYPQRRHTDPQLPFRFREEFRTPADVRNFSRKQSDGSGQTVDLTSGMNAFWSGSGRQQTTRLGHSNWHAAMAGLFQIQPFEIDVLG